MMDISVSPKLGESQMKKPTLHKPKILQFFYPLSTLVTINK